MHTVGRSGNSPSLSDLVELLLQLVKVISAVHTRGGKGAVVQVAVEHDNNIWRAAAMQQDTQEAGTAACQRTLEHSKLFSPAATCACASIPLNPVLVYISTHNVVG